MLLKDIKKAALKPKDREILEKMTSGDKNHLLSEAIYNSMGLEGVDKWDYDIYLWDYDDEYAYFKARDYSAGTTNYWKVGYILNGVTVSLGEDVVQVFPTTTFEELEVADEVVTKSFLMSTLTEALSTFFPTGVSGTPEQSKPLLKQFNDKTNTTVEFLYIAAKEVDAHGDAYLNSDSAYQLVDEVNKAVADGKTLGNYFHRLPTDDFSITKAFMQEESVIVEESGIEVPALQPMIEVEWHSQEAYEMRKSGEILGPSIGCKADIIDAKTSEVIGKSQDIFGLMSGNTSGGEVVKRLLTNFDFSSEDSHIAMTDASVGGPASEKEGYLDSMSQLEKARNRQLTEEQYALLLKRGLSKEILDKAAMNSSPSLEAGEDVTQKENQEETMDKNTIRQIMKAVNKYNLDQEQSDSLEDLLLSLDEANRDVVTKALDALVAAKEEAVAEAIEVTKAKAPEKEKEPSFLEKELGSGAEPEPTYDETTLSGKVAKANANKGAK